MSIVMRCLAAGLLLLASVTIAPAANLENMSPGNARAYIVGIQEELAAHGYKPGPADGVMGPRTRSAIRAFQRDTDLPVTGKATTELLDRLKFASPNIQNTEPARKPVTAPVAEIQRELMARGYYEGAIDGLAGPKTREAVRAFQNDAGLPVTGEVDTRLLGELQSVDPDIRRDGEMGDLHSGGTKI